MTRTTSKQTVKDQGVPAVYLGPTGNFKPGYDASLKRDLVHAVLGLPNPNALHRFTAKKAQQLLDARGWQQFADAKRKASR
jgi:hypothetical protein